MRIEITDAPSYRDADLLLSFTNEVDEKLSNTQTVALDLDDLRQLRDKINERLGES